MRRATRGNVLAAIAVLALAGVTWPDPSLAETIVDVATFAQLKAAVHDKTSGPSTLRITNDIYYPTDGSVPSGGIILKYAVRIVGACSSTSLVVSGTVAAGTCMLDAKEVDRHFDVKTAMGSTAEVVFEKLALVNGSQFLGGAVLAHDSGKATFTSCRFIGNKAGHGGAVYIQYTPYMASSFTACTFEGNEAADHGGAVSMWYGASSTFTLCTFQGNRVLAGEWAGHNVWVDGTSSNPSSASFYGCTFLDLLSDANHGVRKGDSDSSFTFYDNAPPLPPLPPAPPGAAYVTSFSDLKTILHNQRTGPSMIYVTQDIYYPTDGSVPSGGIRLKYAVRIVGACSSTSLVVSGTVAAGTCMLDAKEVDRHFQVKTTQYSTAEVVFEKLALVDGKKTGNYDDGGAVDACETGATRFENVIFKDNTVPDAGGAVYATRSGKATFSSCRFIGNKAKGGNAQYGGAIFTKRTASSFTACTFENNEADYYAGAVFLSYGSSSTFTLCTFKGNRALNVASNDGHNVMVYGSSSDGPSTAFFYACTFLDLLSDASYGVRKNAGSYSSVTFSDNAPPLPPGMVLPPPQLTYSYNTGSWSSCSSSCGGGMQTRSVTCYRSDWQSVSDSYCSESKPSAYQSCNTQVCATPKKKGNAAGIAVGVIFAVIVLCVAPWAWSYYRRKVAKDDRDDTVYDMVPVQVAKAQENCLEDFFSFGRKKPNGGSRKFHTMDYAVPPGSNTLAPILVTVPDGMPGAGQEMQWKKPPAFSSGTVVSNITYYYDDDIPPTSSTPEEARTTSPQEVKTMPGGVATFVCTNPVLARASADVNDKLPDLEVNKLAEGVQILASEEGDGKWLRCASEGRFKGFYFPFYHPTSGGAIFKKLDGDLSSAEDQGKQAVSIEMMSVTHVPPPPPPHHQPEVAIPIPSSVGGDEETAAAVAEDGKDIALALLASVRLDKYASAFEELGVRDVRDFFEVTDDDLTALGMSELEKRRFKKQVQSK